MTTIEKNETFELAYRFVTETNENIFLTGKAGTGKTTFLKYLKQHAAKNIIVAAPTGVAAINAGGVTLHSLFQLPFHPFLPTKKNKEELLSKLRQNKQRQQLLRKMELLVIDEISMVRCDIMDAVDTILRSIRRNYDIPFGGVQLLCIGDLHQLQPVAKNEEWGLLSEFYESPFFFDSQAIKEQMPLLIELTKIYRQKEESFVRLLNKVRTNNMDADDYEDLHQLYQPGFSPYSDEKYITLTSHNNQADLINQKHLQRLNGLSFTYTAKVTGDFPEHMNPVEPELLLKEGAQVMFLKNDTIYKRYFNGKIGTVKKLTNENVIVDCDGTDITVSVEIWENSRYTLNRTDGKLEQEVMGTFEQYPLRLAWAITIHKSQGLTFEKVMIDAGAAFSSGQVYVALSRCTSLEGIVLLSKIPTTAITSNNNVLKGQQNLSYKGSLPERFEAARIIFTQQLLEDIFSFADLRKNMEQLVFQLKQHTDKLNQGALEWIENIVEKCSGDITVAKKFNNLVTGLIKEEGIIENNPLLQKRISDAANHFIPRLEFYLKEIQQHPLITEHKETATDVNEKLSELALAIHVNNYFLQYCKQPFSIAGFLQHKLKYATPKYAISCYAGSKKEIYTNAVNPELFDTLKRWRDMVCNEEKLAIYMVANQETLKEISLYLPLNKNHLLQIKGFGKAKVEKYGEDILAAVESYCQRHNVETNMQAKLTKPKKEKKEKSAANKSNTQLISYTLYKEGKTIDEIAKERNFARQTIEGHLTSFIASGDLELNDFVSQEKQQQIKKAVNIHGSLSHKTLLESLPEGISYNDIKMVLAAEKL